MNKSNVIGLVVVSLLLSFCATEKSNVSPVVSLMGNVSQSSSENLITNINNKTNFIKYSSDITNTLNSCSAFSNKKVNDEFLVLKFNIYEYIHSVREYNKVGEEKAFYGYEKSYKRLQKLKHKLSDEELQILDRTLIKIKTDITLIKSIKNTP